MGLANTPEGWTSMLETVPVACKALSNGNLQWWEYGNEPDLYVHSPERQLRTSNATDPWNALKYLSQWKNGTAAIKSALAKHCPELVSSSNYGYVGPSVSGLGGLSPKTIFSGPNGDDGMNENGTIKAITMHDYQGVTTSPGISLQNDLMSHFRIIGNLRGLMGPASSLLLNQSLVNRVATPFQAYAGAPTETSNTSLHTNNNVGKLPLVLNEANSLTYNTFGPTGLLNVFGDALWSLDYLLSAASLGFSRVHIQLGTDFRYSSWQRVTTKNNTVKTMPPYYGNVAAAAMIGNVSDVVPRIVEVPLDDGEVSAYAAYAAEGGNGGSATSEGRLLRVAVLNMHAWNATRWVDGGYGELLSKGARESRPVRKFVIQLPEGLGVENGKEVGVQSLVANGSDVRTGITWDGWSYEYELDEGRGVKMGNVTVGETMVVKGGQVEVQLVDSSAVILNF